MSKKPRILIACEYSAVVRTAFERIGFNAFSCDILPTEIPGNHFKRDVLEILTKGWHWDLLIAFPPCTYLTFAGMANWYDEGRAMKRIKAAEFFMKLYEAPVERICIENPRGIMSNIFRKPDQIIHPYYFGDPDMKRTNLWLKNLPKLEYRLSDDLFGKKTAVEKPKPYYIGKRKDNGRIRNIYFTDTFINGKFKTGLQKSKTFPGIATAMAEQWGKLLLT